MTRAHAELDAAFNLGAMNTLRCRSAALKPLLRTACATAVAWISCLALPVAALAGEPDVAGVAGNSVRSTVAGRTWISFDTGLLGDLGVEIKDVAALATDDRGRLGFSARSGGLEFWLREGDFEDLVSGSVTHAGGFSLRLRTGDGTGDSAGDRAGDRAGDGVGGSGGGGAVAMSGFALRPGPGPHELELVSRAGEVVFTADHMHVSLDRVADQIALFNLDLRISAALAMRLARPELTGLAVGTLAFHAAYDAPIVGTPRGAICTAPNWLEPDVEVDVALIGIDSVQQSGAAQNGSIVMAPSATLENVGTSDVAWWEKFSGAQAPYGVSQHPFLVWALYRVADGQMQQIGRSAVKHAFYTVNSSCTCFGGQILWSAQNAGGMGCRDTYSTATNNDQINLGPREEIEAHLGTFDECGSHFDPACAGTQTHTGGHSAFEHKMQVRQADLATSGASYYFHSWYVVRDDVDIFNTMGFRKLTPAGPNFPFESALIAGSPLDAWVNPANPPADSANHTLDAGDGHLQLAVQAVALGAGAWRYDYALLNHDFDRQVESFTLPLPNGANVLATTFRDLDDDATNDWQPTVAPGSVTWQAPAGNALDWGTLFNFSIEANARPARAAAELGALEVGGPDALAIDTLAPGAPLGLSCGVATNKQSYASGEQVFLTSLRYVNQSGAPVPIRLRLQIRFGTFTGNLIDVGASGGITVPNGFDLDLAPRPLLVVQPSMPRGSWSLRCALEDPSSGEVLTENVAPMTFE